MSASSVMSGMRFLMSIAHLSMPSRVSNIDRSCPQIGISSKAVPKKVFRSGPEKVGRNQQYGFFPLISLTSPAMSFHLLRISCMVAAHITP